MRRRLPKKVSSAACVAMFASACAASPRPAMPNDGHDSSPLMKCSIAASHSEPLVTEWPASSKARLEALLTEGAVAVAYSGCELRIIDACRPKGAYKWSRTTLSTDTTEIRSEDDLYTKLPLGAATLEGELRRAGSLSVRTTVAGQMKLVGADDANATGSCAEVTHVVTAVSIGAFELRGGAALGAGGGVSLGAAGGGAHATREETVMHSAGDPRSCDAATDESPSAACRSPIQVFLRPIAGSSPRARVDGDPDLGNLGPEPSMRPSKTWGYVLGVLGLGSIAAGTYFMIASADAKTKIKNGGYATGADIDSAARSSASSGNLAIGFLAGGGVMFLSSIPLVLFGGDGLMVPTGRTKAARR
jgi:hypothetical protein